MLNEKKRIKVLYNESHSNVNSTIVPQGGPTRFVQEFRKYFSERKDVELCPLLFSHEKDACPYIKKTSTEAGVYFEIAYETHLLRSMYHVPVTRRTFSRAIKPFIEVLSAFMHEQKPDIVFLNAFGINNWLLMKAANKCGIPVVIQHAGIWKKEIKRFTPRLSEFMRKAFYDMERDTIRYCSHHIFLNEFSRRTFIHLYKRTWNSRVSSSIIPLPIVCHDPKKVIPRLDFKKNDSLSIGMVARWDTIKNHPAMLRLAESKFKPEAWKVQTVAAIGDVTDFEKRYKTRIAVHEPMQPRKLTQFYRAMDIVLLPSHFDVSPTVVAESLRAGTPVIISDQVGWQDTFKEFGLADHIIPRYASGRKIVEVICEVMKKQTANARKYEALQLYIESNHNPQSVFEKYAALFAHTMYAHSRVKPIQKKQKARVKVGVK